MKYKIVKCADPRDTSKMMYRMQPVYDKVISYDRFCELLVQRTHLVTADCNAVMLSLAYQCGYFMTASYPVDLGPLGVVSLSIRSATTTDLQQAGLRLVRGIRVNLRLNAKLKKRLAAVRLNKA